MANYPGPEFRQTWLSWIGATTSVLRALGLEVDSVDVAGYSGYAFQLTVKPGVCPSGPTCVGWSSLAEGTIPLGRSSLVFQSWDCLTDGSRNDRTRAHARQALEVVKREVAEGRPCVVWGVGVPEFSVVHGVEGDDYLVVPWGPVPERCPFDELNAPGGPAVFAWPTERPPMEDRDERAVRQAVRILSRDAEDPRGPGGSDAYERWVAELKDGTAATHGNSYNAQCWAEARSFARDFLARVAERHRGLAFEMARDAMEGAADSLARVAELFPFEASAGTVKDPGKIEKATGALRIAQTADESALSALRRALDSL